MVNLRLFEPSYVGVVRRCVKKVVILTVLGFLAFNGMTCAAGAGNAQFLQAAATTLAPIIEAQNLSSSDRIVASAAHPVFPLKASANNRYLIDQNNVPFLMAGDAPQTLIANLSPADAATYMTNRHSYGINTLWINLLCNRSEGCNEDAKTLDGIAPFTTADDLSTPNPAYFQRADEMISIAAANGMTVVLDPIETTAWLDTLRANGVAKAFAYGQFLGNRYKNFPNIIWMHGNDFQSWQDATDDALVQAVARGIKSMDSSHIQTVELNYFTSGSLDDASWAPLIELNAAYTYFPTYAQVLKEYNRSDFKPVFMVEANYEFEHNPNTDGGSTQNLRRQEYWTMLSGAAGQLYGSFYTWRFPKGWETNLDTPGLIQFGYMKDLFVSRRWYDLIPDQTHNVVTAGFDGFSGLVGKFPSYVENYSDWAVKLWARIRRFSGLGSIESNTYVTAARRSDGSLVIAYLPSIRTITVDMSKLAGPTIARWYDPTNGRYAAVNGSPFTNSGDREFTSPGENTAGDGDWVLVLEASIAQ